MFMYKVAEPNEALIISGVRAHHGPEGDAAGLGRSIVGSMTVEDLIRNREKLTQATRDSSAGEMQKLGLTIDSLQIQEIEDKTGYIENLSAPEASRVAKEARIAQAQADREATEREQEAEAQKAQAEAEQAGPRAAASARQDVVVQETKVAQLEAERTEQKLQAEVRRPADAEAYRQRTLAEAERDARIHKAEADAREVELAAAANAQKVKVEAEATSESTRKVGQAEGAAIQARGAGEGEAVKAKGLAEAEAIRAGGEALAEGTPAELVSADAMQAYRGLPILTNQSRAPARLVAIWPLDHEGSVGEYAALAHAAIDEILP